MPIAGYLSQSLVARYEPITESTSTAVRHLANNEYSADHVLTGCELGRREHQEIINNSPHEIGKAAISRGK